MRSANCLFLGATFALCACSDATGTLQGGEPNSLPPVGTSGAAATSGSASGASAGAASGSGSTGSGSAGSGGTTAATPTWSYLYETYFGGTTAPDGGVTPALSACGLAVSCHQLAGDPGPTQVPPKSGFVCGTTSHECYTGMLNATPPLIGSAYTANPTTAPLYVSLFAGGSPGVCTPGGSATPCHNNMPFTLVYQYTATDLALIAQWMQNGAKELP
jgi:hypothetical protein